MGSFYSQPGPYARFFAVVGFQLPERQRNHLVSSLR